MKRPVVALVFSAALAAFILSNGATIRRARAGTGQVNRDTLWYHASDVALLAATGRPQLVEFFHPD